MLYYHWMIFDHYLLLFFAIFPLLYKLNFWLYLIQLKEYRLDRLKEYFSTPQWNSAIINIWSIIELPLFLCSFYVFFDEPFELILYPILFYFILIQNLFIFVKFRKKHILKPKNTSRIKLIKYLLLITIIIWVFLLKYNLMANYIYTYILFIYLFLPLILLFIVIITNPIVSYKKNIQIKKAIEISNKNTQTIKIWITWSYWKSSVKEYLASLLEQYWNTLKTPENNNTEMWVSNLIIKKLNDKYKYFVAEMWAYRIWEIDLLWKIVNHKYWFLTAIWNQHLWLFWSLDNIKKWKSEIMNSVIKNNGTLYINWDNQKIRELNFPENLKIVKYGNYKWSDTKYEILWVYEWKTKFIFEYKWSKSIFFVPLIWEHNILNISWIISFCYDIWMKTSDLNLYLKNIKSPKNTLSISKKWNITLIDDTYNLSEEWLFSWLEVLSSFEWKKILVLDDILELWKDSKRIHFELWKKISNYKNINFILYVWKNYKKDFLKWLTKWWFDKKWIINKIDLNILNEKYTILFEWRWSKKYICKIDIKV